MKFSMILVPAVAAFAAAQPIVETREPAEADPMAMARALLTANKRDNVIYPPGSCENCVKFCTEGRAPVVSALCLAVACGIDCIIV